MSEYVKNIKVKDGDKNNKFMFFVQTMIGSILEKPETIWTKIEEMQSISLNALPVYDDRYIKTKISIFGDKIYDSFHGLNAPEDRVEFESFTIISIDCLLAYESIYCLKVYFENFADKIVDKGRSY